MCRIQFDSNGTLPYSYFTPFSGENAMEKKGNKENYNESTIDQSSQSSEELDEDANVNTSNNASIDTSFIINNANDHATIQHQSSTDQHTEL